MKIEFSKKIVVRFLITVVLVLLLAGGIHCFILDKLDASPGSVIYTSYGAQFLLSISSFLLLARFSQKRGDQVGFAFLGLSLVKFLAYILGFRIYFRVDGEVSQMEYAIFFVPYILALAVEIGYLVYVLNKIPVDPDKVVVFEDEEE